MTDRQFQANDKVVTMDSKGEITSVMDGSGAIARGTTPQRQYDERYLSNITGMDTSYADMVYRTYSLATKIVDIIAIDSLRNWRTFVGSDDENHAKAIAAYEMQAGIDLQTKTIEAYKLARAHGGAAMYIGLDGDNAENLKNELNPKAVKQGGLASVNVFPRNSISIRDFDRGVLSKEWGMPQGIVVSGLEIDGKAFGGEIHHSRFVFFKGVQRLRTDITMDEGLFWGDSVLLSRFPIIRDLQEMYDAVLGLTKNQQISIFKIEQLLTNLQNSGQKGRDYEAAYTKVSNDFGTAAKNNKALFVDASWDFQQFQNTFTGLPELINSFRQLLSAACDIPHTKLWNDTPDGMNATGKGDDKNYKAVLLAEQSLKIAPPMRLLDQVLIRAAVGNVEGLTSRFNSPYDADIGEQLANAKLRLEILDMVGPELGAEYADRLKDILDSPFMKGE